MVSAGLGFTGVEKDGDFAVIHMKEKIKVMNSRGNECE